MDILKNSTVTLGPNEDLPALPAWKAPSFWAQFLAVLMIVLNAMGIDLMALTAELGFGRTPEEVVATGEHAVSLVQQLLPILFGVWGAFERRAPNFRLTLGGDSK